MQRLIEHPPAPPRLGNGIAAPPAPRRRLFPWIGSTLLVLAVLGAGGGLAAWKRAAVHAADAAAANQPEPTEVITVAAAEERAHQRTMTAIGTVLALRSITLSNELPGTVRDVRLVPGAVVEEGDLLVALDVSVEEAELRALEAQAVLAETTLGRMERAGRKGAIPEMDVDKARAERDVALAQIARTKAVIARKTIRAPFRARVGMADVHPGQYLDAGTTLTTLQGVAGAAHVDFSVPQRVAAGLAPGDAVQVRTAREAAPLDATVVAVDARVDPATRNATVRARLEGDRVPAPGASVRVLVPVGASRTAAVVPASAVRKGPQGDHVFVVAPDDAGQLRAHLRPVVSGALLGNAILIQEGLAPGEQVAASGAFKLREGALVAVGG